MPERDPIYINLEDAMLRAEQEVDELEARLNEARDHLTFVAGKFYLYTRQDR